MLASTFAAAQQDGMRIVVEVACLCSSCRVYLFSLNLPGLENARMLLSRAEQRLGERWVHTLCMPPAPSRTSAPTDDMENYDMQLHDGEVRVGFSCVVWRVGITPDD